MKSKARVEAIRDKKGRYAGTKPMPREVWECACGDHAFCLTASWGIVLVSVEDIGLIKDGAVAMARSGRNFYALRKVKSRTKSLHSLVLPGVKNPFERDHENRNGLDNRRSNLRVLTRGNNNRNRRPSAPHGFIGVTFHKASGLWRGYAVVDGKQKSAGYFKTPVEAASARDLLIEKLEIFTASLNGDFQ